MEGTRCAEERLGMAHSLTPPIPGNFRFWCILSIKENLSCAFKIIIVQYNLYMGKQVKP